MARGNFQHLPSKRQEEILAVAAEEFARSGFQGTSYNQLLERLKLGKSSAYYYFDGKRDLFLTVLQRCYETYFAAIKELERPTSAEGFWAYVETSARLGYNLMLDDPTAAHLMQCMQREKELLGELVSSELLASMEAFYDDALRGGQELGAIRTDLPRPLLISLVRDIAMTFDRWFVTERDDRPGARERTHPDRAARLFTDIVRRTCTPAATRQITSRG